MAEPANRDRFLVRALRELASERGIELSSYCHDWVLCLEKGGRVSHVHGYHFELGTATAQLIAGDKAATSALLGGGGVPHVEHRLLLHPREASYVGSAGNWAATLAWAEARDFRLVVKPNEGSGGREVARVSTALELEDAVHRLFERHRSLALSPYLEIEGEIRCVMLEGEPLLLYAKERPSVAGNGRASVAELTLAQLGPAGFGTADLATDELARVPAPGEQVLLRWKHNLGAGATPRDLAAGPLAERAVELARRAAATLGVALASIDLVEVAGELAVLEVNTGIMLESYAKTGVRAAEQAKAIYGEILDRIFRTVQGDRAGASARLAESPCG